MKRITVNSPEKARAIIQKEIHRTDEARLQHRLHCVLLVCEGKKCAEVAALFKDSVRAVQYWVRRFNELGVDGLRDCARPGRRSRMSPEVMEELAKDLRHCPRELGYSQNLWDGKLLSHHLKEKYYVELKVRQCQNLFHQLGFRRRKPRPVIARSDPEAQQAYKKT